MAHNLKWKPGEQGKGFVLKDGSVFTWPVDRAGAAFGNGAIDGMPAHMEVFQQHFGDKIPPNKEIGEYNQGKAYDEAVANSFWLDPKGALTVSQGQPSDVLADLQPLYPDVDFLQKAKGDEWKFEGASNPLIDRSPYVDELLEHLQSIEPQEPEQLSPHHDTQDQFVEQPGILSRAKDWLVSASGLKHEDNGYSDNHKKKNCGNDTVFHGSQHADNADEPKDQPRPKEISTHGVESNTKPLIRQAMPYQPDRDRRWHQGLCGEYAIALQQMHPNLRLGYMEEMDPEHEADWQDPPKQVYHDDYEPEEEPWYIQHIFAHDNNHIYDIYGRSPIETAQDFEDEESGIKRRYSLGLTPQRIYDEWPIDNELLEDAKQRIKQHSEVGELPQRTADKSQWAFDPDEYRGPDTPVHFPEGDYDSYEPIQETDETKRNWNARLPWVKAFDGFHVGGPGEEHASLMERAEQQGAQFGISVPAGTAMIGPDFGGGLAHGRISTLYGGLKPAVMQMLKKGLQERHPDVPWHLEDEPHDIANPSASDWKFSANEDYAYHWTERENIPSIQREGLRTSTGGFWDQHNDEPGVNLTATGGDPSKEWNPDIYYLKNPSRVTIDKRKLDSQKFGPDLNSLLNEDSPMYYDSSIDPEDPQHHTLENSIKYTGNYRYNDVIPPEAIVGAQHFNAPRDWKMSNHIQTPQGSLVWPSDKPGEPWKEIYLDPPVPGEPWKGIRLVDGREYYWAANGKDRSGQPNGFPHHSEGAEAIGLTDHEGVINDDLISDYLDSHVDELPGTPKTDDDWKFE